MAVYENAKIITMLSGAAIGQYNFVKVSGANGTVIEGAANTDICIGIAMESASAADETVPVAIGGVGKIKVTNSTITRGALVTCHTDGGATAAASGDTTQGVALSTAATNDIIDILVVPSPQTLA